MGLLRFRVYERDRLGDDGLGRIYVAGMEDIVAAMNEARKVIII